MEDVKKLFMGQMNVEELYSQEVIEFDSPWGEQH